VTVKVIVLLAIAVLMLSTVVFQENPIASAAYASEGYAFGKAYSISIESNGTKFILTVDGWGTPPYTYQWYTQLMFYPPYIPGTDHEEYLAQISGKVPVPIPVQGANASTFFFTSAVGGNYSVSVRIKDSLGNYILCPSTCPYYIYIHPTPPINITLLTPENTTYNTGDIPLNFTVSEPAKLVSYSIDARANVPITMNSTLTGLSNGAHNITLCAADALGNTRNSETISFMVTKENGPVRNEFLSVLPAAIVVIAFASVACIIVYPKNRHR
jgi:hypothetical protein